MAEVTDLITTPREPARKPVPLDAGLVALAAQVRVLGDGLRDADEQIADRARLSVLQLRSLAVLAREDRPLFIPDLADKLQATEVATRAACHEMTRQKLVTFTDDDRHVEITQLGDLLQQSLYQPLDHRLADYMKPQTVAVLEAVQKLVTAWHDACQDHGYFLRSLPMLALVDEAPA